MGALALAFTAFMAVFCATSYTLPPPLINHASRSALFGLLYAMGFNDTCVASALDTCVATPQESQSTPPVPSAHRSVLFGLFQDLGFSDTCVASALDVCAGVKQEGQIESLLKEARDLQQEERDIQQEERDLQREERDLQREERDLQREERDLQREERDLQQEGIDLQQEERDLQQETRDLMQETRDLLQNVVHTVNKAQNPPRHCKHLLDAGDAQSGMREVYPYPGLPDHSLKVYCDQATEGGGWTVFQRRTNSTVREDFIRTWFEYMLGFGNIEEEFWLGLDSLHALTSIEPQELRVDLADWEGGQRYAKYGFFYVDDRDSKYRLSVVRYSGTAGDSLKYHHGEKFSAHDSDNDSNDSLNCAEDRRGAWWYKNCAEVNLNGYQYENNPAEQDKGITWEHWHGDKYSLRHTTMMLRPAKH